MSQRNYRSTGHGKSDGAFRGAGAYPHDLIPAVRPGDYVRLEPDGDVYQVDLMVPQPGVLAFESGVTVADGDTETDNEAEELEMPTRWLGQYRPTHLGNDIPDGVTVTIDQGGRQSPMYTNKNFRGEYENESATEIGYDGSSTVSGDAFNAHLTELYVHEDEVPYFTFTNGSGSSVTVQNVRFQGFQYRLQDTGAPSGAHVEPLPTARLRD